VFAGRAGVTGAGVRGDAAADVEQVAALRAWSLRLRAAAEAQLGLAGVVPAACDEAGLVGPAGDALLVLGAGVAMRVREAARACTAAADEMDRTAARLLSFPQGGVR
jgi:hypothetical protein